MYNLPNNKSNKINAQLGYRRLKGGVMLMKRTVVVLLSLLVVCLIAAIATKPKSLASKYADAVVPGNVNICGTDVSDMKFDEVYSLVSDIANEKLFSISITIAGVNKSFVLTADSIGAYIDVNKVVSDAFSGQATDAFTIVYDENKLMENINRMSTLFNLAPVEPVAIADSLANEPAFIYVDGADGYALDTEHLFNEIKSCLNEKRLTALIEPKLDTVKPKQTIDDLKANTVLRGHFQSSYGASSSLHTPERMLNILKAARKLNGCVVMPGEEFSFNDYIGPRTYDLGWAPAPGIVDGSTYENQAGGGICQVSSTLHIALMRSGEDIEITYRKNHSWPSSYIDTGLDATVSTGGPDFKFVNRTNKPLYIFAFANNTKYTMDVYIYGEPLPEGTKYEVRAVIDEIIDPEPTKIVEEPTWPQGYKETVITSRKGYKTTCYRDKIVNGKVVETVELYKYYYRPKQGEIHVGTGDPSLPKP